MTTAILLLVLLCLLIEGFFSGSETALISADKAQLRAAARRGDRRAGLVTRLLERSEALLSTTLVGTNLSVVAGTSLATVFIGHHVPHGWESSVTTAVMAPLILIIGEIVPKSIARATANSLALRVAAPLRLFQRFMHPVVLVISRVADALLALVGVRPSGDSPYVTREELMVLTDMGEEHGVLVSEERRMIHSVLALRDRPVVSAMVPLVNIVSVPLDATVAQLDAVAARAGFTRYPVYEGRVDNIVGIVSVVDVLRGDQPADPAATPILPFVRRDVTYVPETKPVGELLRELRYAPVPMAIVVEEYGGVVGLATAADLVEEIIGDIRDERLGGAPNLIARGSDVFECDGTADVDELAELTGLAIRKEGFETAAGLVLHLAGRIPRKGEKLPFGPFAIEVLDATPRHVRRLRFTRTAKPPA
ncbi:MAG: HlyC/CorC family transporter [Planctomycetes bacterium]|nr:HlyC/CorC family transporter [Planctomycetota bacterium]